MSLDMTELLSTIIIGLAIGTVIVALIELPIRKRKKEK